MATKKNKKTVADGARKGVASAVDGGGAAADGVAAKVVDFPIVGIGASAGGLAAFEAFFSGMPVGAEPGMAFVVVQHLAPDHKSALTDLIKRYTRMEVFEVEDGMVVRPNCTYIIPPNRDMAFLGGALQLLTPSAPRGLHMPIDFFFRSLAQDQHEKAVCIVLSGAGSDGAMGARAIKSEGGMVMVQSPDTTECDGMPRSVIATGLVDFELPPVEMPAQLIRYAGHAFGNLPRRAGGPPASENALKKIFILLRAQTGHDFSQYKPSTIIRRIERRMALHQIETIDCYVKHALQAPVEVEALFRDLLIGVTHFFRDPQAFQALQEQVVPRLCAGKPAGGTIRVWSPGCATGEEAYSLAILFAEHQELLEQKCKVQVFATDIDSHAIAVARAGLYPASIAADVSPERLARYFSVEADCSAYRIHKTIRDMLVFSEQDVIRDPPFSKLDLISCRNLLIYMGSDLQKKLIPLFYYALNPGGFLFLGTSETVGDFSNLFAVLDRKLKAYQRKDAIEGASRVGLGSFLPPLTALATSPTSPATAAPVPRDAAPMGGRDKTTLRETTERALLQQLVAAGALVNGNGDILYIHGRTGMYLEPAEGEVGVYNILKMAREGLRHELTLSLHKVVAGAAVDYCPGLRVRTNGSYTPVNLTVRRVAADLTAMAIGPVYLVILEEQADDEQATLPHVRSDMPAVHAAEAEVDLHVAALQQELRAKEEYLQTTNEELKSSNEEMQSINEELQSTNEELETSKEELQSVNEELATVNAELQNKVADLTRANNDMNNLLAGTGIGTIFVDHGLRILRFTPTATKIINLIQSDIGRPVGHIVSNLVGYDALLADIQDVLDTLVPKEVEVYSRIGMWYTMRILPYRTLENVIEGAVITFTDITESRQMKAALSEAHTHLAEAIVATLREPLLVLDGGLRVVSANNAFYTTFQTTADASLGRLLFELGDGQWDIPALHTLLEEILARNTVFNDFVVTQDFDLIGRRSLRLNARRIFTEPGLSELILLAIEESPERRAS
jgi:two-component system CheB/CheR fusion protein